MMAKIHACQYDPRNDCAACREEEESWDEEFTRPDYDEDDGPDPADREPSPEQERAWDLREDDIRGHVLADAHANWMGEYDYEFPEG